MKYKLIIDKNVEEEIIAIVHSPSSLTEQIENLVCSYSGADSIMGYRDKEKRKLPFQEIFSPRSGRDKPCSVWNCWGIPVRQRGSSAG